MLFFCYGLFLTSQVQALNDKCRVLAIGGGTDKGAYEAGAIIGLIESLPSGEAAWDVVVGNGAGAINAMFLAQYAQGSETSAASALQTFWTNFTPSLFYKDWLGGVLTGLLAKSGLYNTAPMNSKINNISNSSPKRFLGVGAADLTTGRYVFFNSTKASLANLNTGIYASASEYFFFPYVEFSGYRLTTGSIKYSVDIYSGINACKDMGYSESSITVDIVLGTGKNLEVVDASNYKTLQILLRYLDISSYHDSVLIVQMAEAHFQNVNFRTVIYPSENLKGSLTPYSYTSSQLATQLALGKSDAKAAVSTIKLAVE
jgi:hypothetical protein